MPRPATLPKAHPRAPRTVLVLLGLLFLSAVVAKAWIADDAYITLRTVDNLVRGLGLTWNPSERVQVYTHPLWMLVLAAARFVTGETYTTTIAIGVLTTLGAVLVLVLRLAPSVPAACLGLAVLTASRAFTDYATAGLEGPLTHLLFALFLTVIVDERHRARRLWILSILAGLALVTRLDSGLLFLPPLIAAAAPWRRPARLGVVLLGLGPFWIWEIFSLVYYGFPFPNTAYAKLGSGLGVAALAPRGLLYLVDSLQRDPITLVVTVAGIIAGLASRDRRLEAVAAGIVLDLVYVVAIGGDFMSGRILTASLFAATALLIRYELRPRTIWAVTGMLVLAALLPPFSPFAHRRYNDKWELVNDYGVADERTFYETSSSLRHSRGQNPWPRPQREAVEGMLPHGWWRDPLIGMLKRRGVMSPNDSWPPPPATVEAYRPVVLRGAVGFVGYYLGPRMHIVDYQGICDPLLARLPAARPDPMLVYGIPRLARHGFRVGHYCRLVPEGYVETLSTGVNRIRDPDLAAFYRELALVTRGRLFDRRRWRAMWDLNTGRLEPLLRAYELRHPQGPVTTFGTPPGDP